MKIVGILLGVVEKIKAVIGRPSDGNTTHDKSDGPDEKKETVTKEAIDKENVTKPAADNKAESVEEGEKKDGQLAEGVIIPEDTEQSDEKPDGGDKLESLDKETIQTQYPGEGIEPQADDSAGLTKAKKLFKWYGIAAKKRHAVGGLAAGILVLVSLNVTKFIDSPPRVEETMRAPVHIYLASINGKTNDVFYFDRFLILLVNEDQAYISLSVSVTPSSKSVFGEMKTKRTICRSVIYSVLKDDITKKHGLLESMEKLKQNILVALNSVLVTGTVEAVDLSEVFAV